MAWIESNQEIGRHPKTRKLARLLDVSMPAAVGYLHYLWWWAIDFADDGNMSKYENVDIAEAVLWDGDENDIVNAFISSGFIDETENGLVIHDWWQYFGRLMETREYKKEQARIRQQKRRANNNNNGNLSSCHVDVTQMSRVTRTDVTPCHAITVPNSTVPNSTNILLGVEKAAAAAQTHPKEKRFTPPTVEEVAQYCAERGSSIVAEHFVDFYASKGWLIGKNRMKDWKAAVRNWERKREDNPAHGEQKQSGHECEHLGGVINL